MRIMRTPRTALLASCLAFPALAQQVPALDQSAIQAKAQAAVASGQTIAQAQAGATTATPRFQGTTAAQPGNTVPATMPPPISSLSPNKPLTRKEAVGVATAQRWINKFQTPQLDSYGTLHFVDGRGQVQIVAAVDHVTDVALAPGENIFLPIVSGDTIGWIVHTAFARTAGKQVAHITIKPIDAGLSSNLVVHTSKRTISISLTSHQREYMPLVALDIPEETESTSAVGLVAMAGGQQAVQTACDMAPSVPREQFSVRGDNVPWRPVDVYWVATPVGTKTCVEFASDIGSTSLPVLLALADDGGWFSAPTKQIVNVRFVARRYIVDEALSRFVLVAGVGGDQTAITITRRPTQ